MILSYKWWCYSWPNVPMLDRCILKQFGWASGCCYGQRIGSHLKVHNVLTVGHLLMCFLQNRKWNAGKQTIDQESLKRNGSEVWDTDTDFPHSQHGLSQPLLQGWSHVAFFLVKPLFKRPCSGFSFTSGVNIHHPHLAGCQHGVGRGEGSWITGTPSPLLDFHPLSEATTLSLICVCVCV